MATHTEIASTARLLSRAGLVEAFGHVSARTPDGFFITSTQPFVSLSEHDVATLDNQGRPIGPADALPLEAPLHAAIYRVRHDVGAICRTHSRWAVAWGTRAEIPPLVHGLGGLAGEVALHTDLQLVTDSQRADAAATALGPAACLLLSRNGALATGENLSQAAVRAWFLEERCRVACDAPKATRLGAAEFALRAKAFAAEEARAARWLHERFGEDNRPEGTTDADMPATGGRR